MSQLCELKTTDYGLARVVERQHGLCRGFITFLIGIFIFVALPHQCGQVPYVPYVLQNIYFCTSQSNKYLTCKNRFVNHKPRVPELHVPSSIQDRTVSLRSLRLPKQSYLIWPRWVRESGALRALCLVDASSKLAEETWRRREQTCMTCSISLG